MRHDLLSTFSGCEGVSMPGTWPLTMFPEHANLQSGCRAVAALSNRWTRTLQSHLARAFTGLKRSRFPQVQAQVVSANDQAL
jgi:hypothetical protein